MFNGYTVHAFAPGEDLCQFALKSVHSFSKYSVHKLVTDERTNKRTDGQVENIMRPASLDWPSDLSRSGFIYHAERILSAIAKSLVHLLGEGEERPEMGGDEVGKENGREGGGAENGNA